MSDKNDFPEILEDSDSKEFEEKQKMPTIVATVEPENPNKLVDGYNAVEGDIINNVRRIRNDLITKMTANGVPRGAELEMTVSLLNDQESSAHKTATTRLRVKAEDTKAVVASSIIGFLFDEKNKNKDENGESIDPLSISLPEDFMPSDIVDGETSDITKNNDLNVDEFMPIERDI